MALIYWMPMTDGTLKNQGLSGESFTSTNFSAQDHGKLGKCIKTNNNTIESGMTETNWIGQNGCTICGWFKFPESEISSRINSVSSSNTNPTGCLVGWNSYGGIGLTWTSAKPYNNQFSVVISIRENSNYYVSGGNLNSKNLMDEWVHICGVIDYKEMKASLYLNGVATWVLNIPNINMENVRKHALAMNMGIVYGGNGPGLSIPYYCNDVRVYDNPLSPREIKEISKGLVCHYPLNREGFGADNLLSRYVVPGQAAPTSTASAGRTNYYGDYGIIILAQEKADTYFRLFLKEQLVNGETYTISCHASGVLDGSYIHFPLFAQKNSGMGELIIDHNGLCSMTFTMTYSTQTAVTVGNETVYVCFMDDFGRNYVSGQGAITLTHFKLEKGSRATPWIPASTDPLYSAMGLDNGIEYDVSGFCNNGTKHGAITYDADTPRYETSTHINATDQYIKVENLDTSGFGNSYTFSWWSKVGIFSNMQWGFSNGVRVNGMYTGRLWNTGDASNNPLYIPNTTTQVAVPSTGVWHHWAMIGDGTDCKVYQDGELWGIAKTYKPISGTTLCINGWDDTTQYSYSYMIISDFRIYATALSASDVQALYNTPINLSSNGTLTTQGEYVEV